MNCINGGILGGKYQFLGEKKTADSEESTVYRGWGIGIRTPTNRVRVCRATVTQFPNIQLIPLYAVISIIPFFELLSSNFLKFFSFFGKSRLFGAFSN